jgi:AcrR family transcriptional regulator
VTAELAVGVDGRRVRGEQTRERLLTAAVELFGSRGFEATSLKDLAASAGVRAPAIYNHFDSKEDILVAAATWALTDFYRNVVESDDPVAPPVKRLELLVKRHVLYQLEHHRLARANDLVLSMAAWDEVMPAGAYERLTLLLRRYLDVMTELVARITSADSLPPSRVTALAIQSMCDRVPSWYKPRGRFTPAEVASAYWVLVQGMIQLPLNNTH